MRRKLFLRSSSTFKFKSLPQASTRILLKRLVTQLRTPDNVTTHLLLQAQEIQRLSAKSGPWLWFVDFFVVSLLTRIRDVARCSRMNGQLPNTFGTWISSLQTCFDSFEQPWLVDRQLRHWYLEIAASTNCGRKTLSSFGSWPQYCSSYRKVFCDWLNKYKG